MKQRKSFFSLQVCFSSPAQAFTLPRLNRNSWGSLPIWQKVQWVCVHTPTHTGTHTCTNTHELPPTHPHTHASMYSHTKTHQLKVTFTSNFASECSNQSCWNLHQAFSVVNKIDRLRGGTYNIFLPNPQCGQGDISSNNKQIDKLHRALSYSY